MNKESKVRQLTTPWFELSIKKLPEEFGFLKDGMLGDVFIYRIWKEWHLFFKLRRR